MTCWMACWVGSAAVAAVLVGVGAAWAVVPLPSGAAMGPMRGPVVIVGMLTLSGFEPNVLAAHRSAATPINAPKMATLITVAASLPPRRGACDGCVGGCAASGGRESDGLSSNMC